MKVVEKVVNYRSILSWSLLDTIYTEMYTYVVIEVCIIV